MDYRDQSEIDEPVGNFVVGDPQTIIAMRHDGVVVKVLAFSLDQVKETMLEAFRMRCTFAVVAK